MVGNSVTAHTQLQFCLLCVQGHCVCVFAGFLYSSAVHGFYTTYRKVGICILCKCRSRQQRQGHNQRQQQR